MNMAEYQCLPTVSSKINASELNLSLHLYIWDETCLDNRGEAEPEM